MLPGIDCAVEESVGLPCSVSDLVVAVLMVIIQFYFDQHVFVHS